jgi:hypothetical protein
MATEETEDKYFSEEAKRSILEMAKRPIALLTIAQAHGIPPTTLSSRVEEEDEFGLAFQKERANIQSKIMDQVMEKGDTDWRMWFQIAERLFPQGYAKEKANTIKIEASAFDWNQLGRLTEKDLPKREVKHIEAESVEVDG